LALKQAKSLEGQAQANSGGYGRLRYQGTPSRGGAGGAAAEGDFEARADLAKDQRVTKNLAEADDAWRQAATQAAVAGPNAQPAVVPAPVELAAAKVAAKPPAAATPDLKLSELSSSGIGGGVAGVGAGPGNSISSGTVTLGDKSVAVQKGEVTNARDLNLGNQSSNGWNYVARNEEERKNATGYRIVGNYAQQNRVVNNRAFYLNGNQWTDNRVQNAVEKNNDIKKIKVVFASPAYFELMKNAEAAQYMALGNNVTFELDGKIYDIVDEEPAATQKQ
jgi:hypothetical protein